MTIKEKFLKKIPKKYYDRLKDIYAEDDLIDDCKYIIEYTDSYTDGEIFGGSYPIRSFKEGIEFLRGLRK